MTSGYYNKNNNNNNIKIIILKFFILDVKIFFLINMILYLKRLSKLINLYVNK
jgi:hypothetical protein